MPKAKYQFTDFLNIVPNDQKPFVNLVQEELLLDKYKPKLTITKSTGFQLAYHQPQTKTTAGIILIFFTRNENLMIRIYGLNHKKYLDLLENLPEHLESQTNRARDCVKFADPDKCWKGCKGYDFTVRGIVYQKCAVDCFEYKVEAQSETFLLEQIKAEVKGRIW